MASGDCTRNVVPAADAAIAYKARGNRCEGFYERNDSAPLRLELLGIHASDFPDTPLDKSAHIALKVAGALPNDTKIELHVISTKPRLYYAMDTRELDKDNSFGWDASVISATPDALSARQLGAYACTLGCLSDDRNATYLPVLWKSATAQRGGAILISFRSPRNLQRLKYSLMTEQGGQRVDMPEATGAWAAGRKISLPLPSVAAGTWWLEIIADAEDSNETTHWRRRLLIPTVASR